MQPASLFFFFFLFWWSYGLASFAPRPFLIAHVHLRPSVPSTGDCAVATVTLVYYSQASFIITALQISQLPQSLTYYKVLAAISRLCAFFSVAVADLGDLSLRIGTSTTTTTNHHQDASRLPQRPCELSVFASSSLQPPRRAAFRDQRIAQLHASSRKLFFLILYRNLPLLANACRRCTVRFNTGHV